MSDPSEAPPVQPDKITPASSDEQEHVQAVPTSSESPLCDVLPSTSETTLDSEVKPAEVMPFEALASAENEASEPLETEISIQTHVSTSIQTPSDIQNETVPPTASETSSSHEISSPIHPSYMNFEALPMLSVIPAPALLNAEVDASSAITGHVCTDEPLDQASLEDFERSMRNYRPQVEEENLSSNLGSTRGPELIESIAKIKMKQNPGPSTAVGDPISDQNIFSEATEYEEEFLLTENMVNSYTFSEESKSTDYSNTDSPMESGKSIAEAHVANDDNIESVEQAIIPAEPQTNTVTDIDKKTNEEAEKVIDAELSVSEFEKQILLSENLDEDDLLNTSDDVVETTPGESNDIFDLKKDAIVSEKPSIAPDAANSNKEAMNSARYNNYSDQVNPNKDSGNSEPSKNYSEQANSNEEVVTSEPTAQTSDKENSNKEAITSEPSKNNAEQANSNEELVTSEPLVQTSDKENTHKEAVTSEPSKNNSEEANSHEEAINSEPLKLISDNEHSNEQVVNPEPLKETSDKVISNKEAVTSEPSKKDSNKANSTTDSDNSVTSKNYSDQSNLYEEVVLSEPSKQTSDKENSNKEAVTSEPPKYYSDPANSNTANEIEENRLEAICQKTKTVSQVNNEKNPADKEKAADKDKKKDEVQMEIDELIENEAIDKHTKTDEEQIEINESIDKDETVVTQDDAGPVEISSGDKEHLEKKLPEESMDTTEAIPEGQSDKGSDDKHTATANQQIVKTPSEDIAVAGPSEPEKENTDSSDGMPVLEDSLGLFAEGRTLLREDDDDEDEEEDDDDDVNNDDEESNQMAPDSSEVESNAAVNEDAEIDQSEEDTEQTNQSASGVDTPEDEIDQSLESIALAVMNIGEDDAFPFAIAAVAGGDSFKKIEEPQKIDEVKGSPKKVTDIIVEAEKDTTKSPEKTDLDTSMEKVEAAEVTEKLEEKKDDVLMTVDCAVKTASPSKSPAIDAAAMSPSKTKKLEIAKPGNVMNIVELEESSSDSDVQESGKTVSLKKSSPSPAEPAEAADVTSVNIPKEIDIMSTSCGDTTSNIVSEQGENVIKGIPAPPAPKKTAPRINTSEITIKTHPKTPEPPTITIPDEVDEETIDDKENPPDFRMEVFNVDSDEEEAVKAKAPKPDTPKKLSAIELQKARDTKKCVNYLCVSGADVEYVTAPSFVLSYYETKRSRRCPPLVCTPCLHRVCRRTVGLMEGVREARDLLSLDMEKECQEFVEISDSDSDSDGDEAPSDNDERITARTIKLLEENLAEVLNETWRKCNMTEQLIACEEELKKQLEEVQKGCAEVDELLAAEQKTMDSIRNELYDTFACEVRELEPLEIYDGAPNVPLPSTQSVETAEVSDTESRRSKRQRKPVHYDEQRRLSPIPLGYEHLTTAQPQSVANVITNTRDSDSPVIVDVKLAPKPSDDNADVSVVKLSVESAPAGLPAPGELQRPPLRVGDAVYAVRQSTLGSWALAKILEIWPPGQMSSSGSPFTLVKIRFEHKLKGASVRQLTGKEVAYTEPPTVRLTIGMRVIALFKDFTNSAKRESYYSGIIAESPTPVNSYRYLVFFDDGYAQYVQHSALRIVYEMSARVWDDVHADSREFVRKYLVTYPERPMVRLSSGQALKTEWNGKWWVSRVVCVDASLVQVLFEADGRVEWIYRGSTRLAPMYLELQAAERHRPRGLTRLNKPAPIKANMPYVEYTRLDEQQDRTAESAQTANAQQEVDVAIQESRRISAHQRAVAKKSTSTSAQVYAAQRPSGPQPLDNLMTRVVYYSPKAAVKPNRMSPHTCSPQCLRTDVIPLKELKTYNPLTRPLLTGWERQILRFKGKKVVMYRAPCGRRVRDMPELHRYLRAVHSDCSVDLFDFNPTTHCLAEFVLNKCYVSKKDLSYGKENVPVPCVNYYDGSLPEYCVYNTERTPTAGVPLNLDPDFLCGCDCTDDCVDKTKCACWKLTLEGARTIGLDGTDVGYNYKRLLEPLPSGIYECNSRCKCAQTCLNRVAQHPLQLKLQVFKTFNRGWGIRALNDVPKGAFLCVYAGNLLTDATANLDGLNEGDEYLAELDYIEVVERMKEGYESDVQDEKKKKGSDGSKSDDDDDEDEEEDDDDDNKDHQADADFQADYVTLPTGNKFAKSLRKRKEEKEKEKEEAAAAPSKETGEDEQFITISDDEEVREPSRFTAQTGLNEDDYVPRHRSVRAVYGKDEACYIMDAKVQGNIGRYLNHSCCPNVFVQNVFVDTHDPRFPWVAFFALCHIQAGTELTWNYNYDIGSVPNKVMYCKCAAPNCRGRLL